MDHATFHTLHRRLGSPPADALLAAALNALESLQDAVGFAAAHGPAGSNAGQWHTAAVELEAQIVARLATGGEA